MPPVTDSNLIQPVLDKMAKDSLILQGGRDENVASLDATVFASINKDYPKRIKLVQTIKKTMSDRATGISGTVVGGWFLNGQVGPLGCDKSKQMAHDTVAQLQADVKAKKITIVQAADQIRNNPALAQLDPQYKNNASFDFQVIKNAPITRNDNLNAALWSLPEGGVSDVVAGPAKVIDKGEYVDAVYEFGQVTKKVNSSISGFDDWLTGLKQKYEVKYY